MVKRGANCMYKNYIFDLYGTLIDIKISENKKQLWEKLSLFYSYYGANYSFIDLKKAYESKVKENLQANKRTKYPDIKLALVFEKLYTDKKVKVDKGLLNNTMTLFRILSTDYIRLYPGVKDLLIELKNKNKKIFILSNGQREFTIQELKYLDIYEYFDALYSSSDIEICKPDSAFFNYLIENEKLNKKEAVFIGNDDKCDIEGAKSVGLDCVYIHSNLSRRIIRVDSDYEIWDGDVKSILRLTEK
jgi:haloacid dehalogenase superfamily, subfamily IA, variant 1 with third motif having Dx(3-4)D or Dx(3-4)E